MKPATPHPVTVRDKRRVFHDPVTGATADSAAPGGGGGAAQHPPRPPAHPATADPTADPGPTEPAAPPAPSGPSAAEQQLGTELAEAKAQAAGYLDDLQRLKAEFDNYRKRMVREQSGLVERAAGNLVLRLLPVLDNFELAVASAEDSHDFDRLLRGIEMVFGELKEVLASEGLERIAAKGQPFDPNYHEAALEVPGDGTGEPYVADELRSGYTFKDRVVRPAMVKVARKGG
ncbi:MAG: nucleotide exchange factor GrpE [Actinomycetota bacterium]